MRADGDTKAKLLGVARDLYLEEGFARFSLREVARRAGVSAAAVYRHYDGKPALLREVSRAGLQIFYSYLLRALSAGTPRDRLAQTAGQYMRFGLENPRDYRVLFMGDADEYVQVVPAEARQGPQRDPTFQFLVDRVRECMAAGVLREADPDETATVVWAHVHGLVSLRLSGQLLRIGDEAAFAQFYEHAADRLIAGLGR